MQNTFSIESLPTCTLQCVFYLLLVILKFTLQSWKVPRGSVEEHCTANAVPVRIEVLTRETCRFFFLFSFFHFVSFFFYDLLVFPFYTKLINSLKVFTCILVFSLRYISERFSSNWQVYPFSTLLNSGHSSKEFGISLLFLFFLSFLFLFFFSWWFVGFLILCEAV